jgi:hypothetical protein
MASLSSSGIAADSRADGCGGRRAPYICDPDLLFVTPKLKQLLQIWNEKRASANVPSRADFSIRDLYFALPNIAIVACIHQGSRRRFRVQLMGSELDAYVGPMTGRFIDEALPERIADKWSTIWSAALAANGPHRSAGRVEVAGKGYYVFEKFCAPLRADGEDAKPLLVATYFHPCENGLPQANSLGISLLKEIEARPATRL